MFRYVDSSRKTNIKMTCNEVAAELREILGISHVWPVLWLPGFFAIPGYVSVSCLGNYTQYFPMDVSSGYVVYCANQELIDSVDNKTVLDLCCCPGGKLQCIADVLTNCKNSQLMGVDISDRRMELCKALFRKNRSHLYIKANTQPRTMLFLCDGTLFNYRTNNIGKLIFDTNVSIELNDIEGNRKRRNKSCREREKKKLKLIESTHSQNINNEDIMSSEYILDFDVVFVDAECSHDGSFRHLSECEKSNSNSIIITGNVSDAMIEAVVDIPVQGYSKLLATEKYTAREESSVVSLQSQLIRQGFQLLRSGGTLIYSTCSLSSAQNEDIVCGLLNTESKSVLVNLFEHNSDIKICEETAQEDIDKKKKIDIDILFSNYKQSYIQSILAMNDSDLIEILQKDDIESIAVGVCEYVASSHSKGNAPCLNSSILPGTALFNRSSGTSGLYVAKIRKM